MLCKDCDYYHTLLQNDFSGTDISYCEFSDMLFLDNVDDLDTEYPCKQISFDEYMCNKQTCRFDAVAAKKYVKPEMFRELKACGVCMLKFPGGLTVKCFRGHASEKTDTCQKTK
jgi:hypothetical protein